MQDAAKTTDPATRKVAEFIADKGIKFVIGKGVRFVIAGAITQLVPTENRKQKVQLAIGSYVISGMVRNQAIKFIDQELAELVDTWNDLKEIGSLFSDMKPEEETKIED